MKTLLLAASALAALLTASARTDLITYTSPYREIATYVPPGFLNGPTGDPAGGAQVLPFSQSGPFLQGWSTGLVYTWYKPLNTYIYAQAEAGQTSTFGPDFLVAHASGSGLSYLNIPPFDFESLVDTWITLESECTFAITGANAAFSITGGPSGPFAALGTLDHTGTLLPGTYHVVAHLSPAASSSYHLVIPAPGAAWLFGAAGMVALRRRR